MPRIRTVKPELASDRRLAAVSRDARYTFVLLISQADDDGLVRAEPRQLLGSLYPHDHDVSEEILERWLRELVQAGRVRWRYTHDGMRVVELVNWSRHQKIKNRSLPFLLTQLTDPSATIPEPSVGSPEETDTVSVGSGGAEPRVLSPEPRVLLPPNGGSPHTNGKHSRAPPVARSGWVNEAVEIYAKHIGIVKHGHAGGLLKPVVQRRGWPEVKAVLECFCELAPYQDYLQRCESGTLRPNEEKVKKLGYNTKLSTFVENYTYWAEMTGVTA